MAELVPAMLVIVVVVGMAVPVVVVMMGMAGMSVHFSDGGCLGLRQTALRLDSPA